MVALAASISAIAMASNLCYSKSDFRRTKPATKVMSSTKLAIQNPLRFSSHNAKVSLSIRARDPQRDNDDVQQVTNNTAFISQKDLDYLWKLVVGSVVGAAIIKYGSVVFPEITRPNITQALLMIVIPVVVAVLLLINQSSKEEPS
ncbi:hypothetical protein L484_003949 [Morus notabilis]|uniref:Uncharacterized protein n=1 Tax=Morus notabilis TaxID=981085 RepID=W9RU97_9ROSA|nr:uncharacterized protein LOC21387464 [Morus notabilis]EXB93678.1 hypothetical protein L484_003949 [Morus notabilis]